MQTVVINHPYLPYETRAKIVRGHLCGITLRKRRCRVVHMNSGLTIKSFKYIQDAKALILRVYRDDKCHAIMGKLTWQDFKEDTVLYKEAHKCIQNKLYNLDVFVENEHDKYLKKVKLL